MLAWPPVVSTIFWWAVYSTDTLEQKKWGALYNWYAVNTGKLAPEGWRVPSEADGVVLNTYLAANGYNYDSTITPSDATTTSAVRKVGKSLASKTAREVPVASLPCSRATV